MSATARRLSSPISPPLLRQSQAFLTVFHMGCCGICGKMPCCGMCKETERTRNRCPECMSIAVFVIDVFVLLACFARSGDEVSATWKRIYTWTEVVGVILLSILYVRKKNRKEKRKLGDEESLTVFHKGCCGICGKILRCGMCEETERTHNRCPECMSIAVFIIDVFVLVACFARSGDEVSTMWKGIYIWTEVVGVILLNILHIRKKYRKEKRKLGDEESQLESASATTNIHSSGSDGGSIHGTNSDGQVQQQIGGISECDSLLPGKTRSDGPSGNRPTPRSPPLVRKPCTAKFSTRSLPGWSTSRPDTAEVPSRRSLQDMEMLPIDMGMLRK